jgi:hypothetical protein
VARSGAAFWWGVADRLGGAALVRGRGVRLVARFVGGVVQKRPRTFSGRFERRGRNLAPNVKRRRFKKCCCFVIWPPSNKAKEGKPLPPPPHHSDPHNDPPSSEAAPLSVVRRMSGAANPAQTTAQQAKEREDSICTEALRGLGDCVPLDLQCSTCMTPSIDNVTICSEGHFNCRTCADQLHSRGLRCTLCRSKLLRVEGKWVTCLTANKAVRETDIPCPHSGCKDFHKLLEMKQHQSICSYRIVPCPCASRDGGVGCEWSGPAVELQEHLREKEHAQFIVQMTVQMATDQAKQTALLHTHLTTMFAEISTLKSGQEAARGQMQEIQELAVTIGGNTEKQRPGTSKRTAQRQKSQSKQIEELTVQVENNKRKIDEDKDAHTDTAKQLEEATKGYHEEVAVRMQEGEMYKAQLAALRSQMSNWRNQAGENSKQVGRLGTKLEQLGADLTRSRSEYGNQSRSMHALYMKAKSAGAQNLAYSCPCTDCQYN